MKELNLKIYTLILFTFLTLNTFGVEIFSTKHGVVSHGSTMNYCTSDPDDFLEGRTPSTSKNFGNIITPDGVPLSSINNVFVGTSTAVISPSTLGPGSYQFYYNNVSQVFYVEITVAPTLTSLPTGTMCSGDSQNYTITTSDIGSNNDWSRAAIAGITEAANTGTNIINETLTNTTAAAINVVYEITPQTGCQNTMYYTVTVNPAPIITSAATGNLCSGLSHSYTITSTIAGATYSWSRAAVAGITEGATSGTSAIISETLTNTTLAPINVLYVIESSFSGCDGPTFTYTLTVNPNPVVSINGLDYLDPNPAPWYCDNDYLGIGDDLTGSPLGGVFSGPGITDLGGGTAKFFPESSGLGLINITYTYTDGNGCTSPLTVTTRVGTQIFLNGLTSQLCENDAADPFSYTPFNASSEILLNATVITPGIIDGNASLNPTDPAAIIGTNTVTYQYTDAAACVNEISQNVDIFEQPVANFSGLDASYCTNDANVLLTGNYAPGGTFSGDGITDNGNGTATFSPSSLVAGGAYNVTYTYTTGLSCSDSETKPVTINSAPTANIIGDATTCAGDATPINITFTATGPYDFNFTYTDGITPVTVSNYGSNTYVTNVNPFSTSTFTVTNITDNNNGCSSTGTGGAVKTVNAVPTANAGFDKNMCLGAGTTLDGSAMGGNGSYTYVWSNGMTGASVAVNPTPVGIKTYTLTVTDGNGCKDTDDVNVDVKSNPTVDAGINQYSCNGEDVTLTALGNGGTGAGTYSYDWGAAGAGATVIVNPTNPVPGSAIQVYTYNVTVTDANTCKGTDNVNVTVNAPSDIVIVNDGDIYCNDYGEVILTATPVGALSTWTDLSGLLTFSAPDRFSTDPGTNSSGSYTMEYSYTDPATGGCTTTKQATIEILPYATPNITDITFDDGPLYCNDDPGPFLIEGVMNPNLTGQAGVSANITGGAVTYIGNNQALLDPTVAGIGLHTITYSVTTPGCSNSYSKDLTVGSPVTYNTPDFMCVGDPDFNLIASNTDGEWTLTFIDDATSTNHVYGPFAHDDMTAVLQASEAGKYYIYYELTATGQYNCSPYDSVTVFPQPSISFTIGAKNYDDNDINFCDNGTQVNLIGTADGVTPASGIFTGTGVAGSKFNPTIGVGTYYITYTHTDINGCSNSVTSDAVTVNEAPIVTIDGLNATNTYCQNEPTITITGNPTNGLAGAAGTFNFPTADWNNGDEYNWPTASDGVAEIVPSNIDPTGSFTIEYEITDLNGCFGSVIEIININPLPTTDFNGLPSAICKNGNPVTLTGSPKNANGFFSGDGVTDNGDGTAIFDPTTQTAGLHTVTYTYTDPITNCDNFKSRNVEIYALPIKYIVTTPSGLHYCENDPGIEIGISGSQAPAPDDYKYYLIQNGLTVVDSLTGDGNAMIFPGNYPVGTYKVKAVNAGGCISVFNNSVTAIEDPEIGDAGSISGSVSVCPDGTTIYTYSVDTIDNAANHVWTTPAGAVVDADRDNEIDVIFDPTFLGGDFEVYGEDITSFCPDGTSSILTVSLKPAPIDLGVAISGDNVVCEGETNKLYSIDPSLYTGETSYEWETTAGTIISNPNASNITVNYPGGSVSGTLRVRAVNGCRTSDWVTLPITVNPTPDVDIDPLAAGDVIDCSVGSQVQLNATSTAVGVITWSWTAANGGVILAGDENVSNPRVTKEGDFIVEIAVTNAGETCYNTDTVTVNADKDAPVISIPGTYEIDCNNPTEIINAVADPDPTITYLWTGPGVTAPDNNPSVTVNAPGTYTLTATDPSNSCQTTKNISVADDTDAPEITIAAALDLTCARTSVTISGSSPTAEQFLWTRTSGTGSIDNPNIATTTVNGPGVYRLTVTTLANGCSNFDEVTVLEAKTLPNLSINPPPSRLTCDTLQVQLTANAVAGATFNWTTTSGGNIVDANISNPYVDKEGLYSVQATHPTSGCTQSASVTVESIYTKPNILINQEAVQITCSQSTIWLDASASTNASEFNWYTTTGNIVSGSDTDVATVSKAGTYNVIVTNGLTGCTDTGQVSITQDLSVPNVDIVAGTYTITCNDPSPNLLATTDPGASVLWTGPGVIDNATSLNPTVYSSGTFTITAMGANGCEATDNVVVTRNDDIPDITVDTATLDITCDRLTVEVSGNSVAGIQYDWVMLTGGGVVTNADQPTAIVNAAGTYELTVTDVNGCTNSDIVTVGQNITAPVITLDAVDDETLTCNHSSVTLNASAVPANSQFEWSTLIPGDHIDNIYSPTPSVDAAGDYTVTVTDPANGCESSATITVNPDLALPTVQIVPVADVISCSNPTIVLDAATLSSNATNYSWVATLGGHIAANSNSATPTIDAAGTYTVTAEHVTTGCTASASIIILKDNSVPTIDVFSSSPDPITCVDLTEDLTANATGTANKDILWTTSGGGVIDTDPTQNTITVSHAGTYVVKITNTDNGCYAVKGVTVEQNDTPPTVNVNTPLDLTCSRTQVTLKATASSADASPLTYNWTAGAGGIIVSGSSTSTPIVSAVADYTVRVTDQGNDCFTDVVVSVDNDTTKADVSVDITPDDLTCSNTSVTLDGSSNFINVSYQWVTSGGGAIWNDDTENPVVNTPGTYNLIVTNEDNGCTTTSPNVIVVQDIADPVVTAFAPSGNLTCNVSEVTISVSSDPDYSYLWSGPGNISASNSNSTNVDAPGDYTVLIEDIYNGCDTILTVTVDEDITKATAPVINNIDTCFGSATNPSFEVITGNNVRWYGDVNLTVYLGIGNTFTPTATTAGTHKYYATSTGANGCESLPTEVTFIINSLPNAPFTIGNAICEGSPAAAITAVGSNIKWYDNSSVFVSSGASYLPGVAVVGSYNYYATQTDGNGCESTKKSTTYIVNSVPAQPSFVNPNEEICETETNPIFNVIGDNIQWYKNIAGAVISTGNTHQPNEILPGTYNYYTTQTVNGCESPEATGTFTINPIPNVFNIVNGGPYCEGGGGADVSLSGSELGVNYELWLDEASMITDVAGTGAVVSFGNQTQIGNYTAYGYYTATSCRHKMNGDVDVSINPLPEAAPTISGDAVICQNQTGIVYSIDPVANATTYVWSVPAGFTIVSGDNSNSITVNVDNTAINGNISVYAQNACGVGTTSPILHVTVNPIPGPAVNLVGANIICNDDDGVVYAVDTETNATYYNWTLPQGATVVAGGNSRQVTLNFDQSAVNDIITVAPANACGEGASASINITVNDLPYVNAGDQQDLCVDNTVLDANVPDAASTGTWSIYNGAATFSSTNDPTAALTNIGEGNNRFVWTVEDANGCALSDTVLITNNTVIVEAGNNQTICEESLTLNGSSVPDGAVGSWSASVGTASFSNGNIPNPLASDFATGTNILKWTITKNGCTTYDSVIITNQRPTEAYAGIDQAICRDTTTLQGNTPAVGIGLWTVVVGAASFDNANDPNTVVRGLSKGENILRWTISNGICSTSDDVKITNNQLDLDAGVDQVICENTSEMDATDPSSGSGYWSVSSGAALFVDINLSNTVVTGLGSGANVLTWNVNNNGCISTDTVVITNDFPTQAYAGKDTIIMSDIITLQGNIPGVGNGVWSLVSGAGIITNPSLYNTTVTSLGYGENRFRWTITNNSCISTDDVLITNYMSIETDAGPDQTICSGETFLEGNAPAIGYGEWSVIQGSATFADPSNPLTEVTKLASGDNILRWSVWQNGWTSDEVVITNDSPTEANAGLDQTLCVDSTDLAANEPVVGSGKWTVVSGAGTFEDDTLYNTKVTNLSQGENIFKWTITNKSCNSSDIVIVNNDYPTLAVAGFDQIICESTVTLIPNTPSIGTGTWSVVSGSAYFEGNTAKNVGKDVNIFRWTITNNSCSTYDDITITNNEPSEANAGANKVLCLDSVNLNANLPVVGTAEWTIQSGSSTIDDILNPTTKVTDLSQGINVFRWTITYNNCIKYDEVTINNAFVEADAGPVQDICSETTILEANNPSAGTGMWSVLGGSGSAVFEDRYQADTRVSGLDKGDNILQWTITNEICSSSDTVRITNGMPTEAFAGPDQALCADNSILQGNTPTHGTGNWSILSGSANIAAINNPSSTISNLDYGVNTLRWTISNGACSSTDEVVIANNSTIASNAGLDQTLCVDSTVLYANVPTYGTGTWLVVTGSATFENNNDYNSKVRNVGKGTNILRWVITNGGCSSTDEVLITNNAPSKSIAGADQTICGDSAYLQANDPLYGTGTWSLVSGAASFEDASSNTTLVRNLNPGSNTLRWTTENNGCTSTDDVIIYNDLPYKAYAGEDFSVCATGTPLYANDPVTGTGQWTVISGAATFDDPTNFETNVSELGFGANTLRWTITYERCTTSDEVIITSNELEVYAGIDQTVTKPTTLLAASNPSTGTGLWTVIGGSGSFAYPNKSITEVSGLGSGLNTFRWSVNISGCVNYDDVSVTYNVPPVASFVVSTAQGCPPLEVYFVNNSLDDLPFTWDFDDGGVPSNDVSISHIYNNPGTYKPSLTVISNEGVEITRDTTITVYPKPEASFLVVNKEVYIPEEKAIFVNTSIDASTYRWEFGDGGTSTERDPKYVYSAEGIYDVLLEVWSVYNCYDSTVIPAGIEVFESGGVVFPNAFTPNLGGSSGGYYDPNDFSNDVFYPISEGIEDYHLEIFNKWGILVFESKDINIGWDGYLNGKLLNEGVYVWKVSGKLNNGKDFKKVGTVLLIK